MGVRFPIEQSRPDLSEVKEAAPPTKSTREQPPENRVPTNATAQDNLRTDEKTPPSTAKLIPAQSAEDKLVPSNYKTTGIFIDILA